VRPKGADYQRACLFAAILYSEHRLISAFNNPSSDISAARTLPALLALLCGAIYFSTLTSYKLIAIKDAQDSVRDRIAADWRTQIKSVADLRAAARDAVASVNQAAQTLMLIGFFEGLDSERGIAWRVADSLSLREFLGYGIDESTPDHQDAKSGCGLDTASTPSANMLTVLSARPVAPFSFRSAWMTRSDSPYSPSPKW